MKNNEFTSIFDNVSDLEFEIMLQESGFTYNKVKEGEGGLSIQNQKVDVNTFFTEKVYNNIEESGIYMYNSETFYSCSMNDEFDMAKQQLGEAA